MADKTFYPTTKVVVALAKKAGVKLGEIRSFDTSFSFKSVKRDEQQQAMLYRAVVCSCYAGKSWSITARKSDREASSMVPPPLELTEPDLNEYADRHALEAWPADLETEARKPENRVKRLQNANLVDELWRLIAHDKIDHGLVVVAGATGSRKTSYAREIARRYLSEQLGKPREKGDRPHVVTYEDPIESWFAFGPRAASAAGFEYTPRQHGKDTGGLDEVLTDALRQKPALLYVNEVRRENDWRRLMGFAGTGHLAITTTHAGSLVEAFERILAAEKVKTADERSRIGSRIVAVVHIRSVRGTLLPAMWVQTARSRFQLTQDGLASLIPTGEGCFGRKYFASRLGLGPEIIEAAFACDLVGE